MSFSYVLIGQEGGVPFLLSNCYDVLEMSDLQTLAVTGRCHLYT